MNNPYLLEFEACHGDSFRYRAANGTEFRDNRSELVRKYSWAVPTERAVRLIASLGPIVEIGAGNGYWASLIAGVGGDILAFDERPYDNKWCNGSYHLIFVGGPEKAGEQPDRALFLCWPPYAEPFADECLRRYVEAGGRTLVYIGEGSGGCTGDDAFHDYIEDLCDSGGWDRIDCVRLPQWEGIHDYLFVYRKR